MPELNANIPPIDCFVRGNFLRNQQDSHDKYFPCVIFGVASVQNRSPLFHFLMEDGSMWWRAPINAFCTKAGVKEEPIYNLVLWNSFSPYIAVTKFANLANLSLQYTDRNKKQIKGKYLFTLDWHNADSNRLDDGYSETPDEHKCGHVIQREDGNFAIQPNNRIRVSEPSFTTKKDLVIHKLISDYKWDVESYDKWILEDSDSYHYDISAMENEGGPALESYTERLKYMEENGI